MSITARTGVVATHDGVELVTDCYLPSKTPAPAVLARTPYGRRQLGSFGRRLLDRGFAFVAQDVRGTGGSAGRFDPLVQEPTDAAATVEWLEKQPWLDNEAGVGILGISYLFAASAGAVDHATVRSAVSVAGIIDADRAMAPHGPLNLHHMLPWSVQRADPGTDLAALDWEAIFETTPLEEAAAAAGCQNEFWTGLTERIDRDQPLGPTLREFVIDQDLPTLHISGWYDVTYPATQALYATMVSHTAGPQCRVIGPWSHNGILDSGERNRRTAGAVDPVGLIIDWFDRWHLSGAWEPSRLDLDDTRPVVVYDTGVGRWRNARRWPPRTDRTCHLVLGRERRLTRATPRRSTTVTCPVDLESPVPSVGGRLWTFEAAGLEPGPADRRPLHARDDIVVWRSEPLEERLTLFGASEARLDIACGQRCFDVTAKLVDITPDGQARWVTDGVRRFEGPVDGRVTVPMLAASHSFTPGHRVGLELAGTDFPRWARPPVTGDDATRFSMEIRAGRSSLALACSKSSLSRSMKDD